MNWDGADYIIDLEFIKQWNGKDDNQATNSAN